MFGKSRRSFARTGDFFGCMKHSVLFGSRATITFFIAIAFFVVIQLIDNEISMKKRKHGRLPVSLEQTLPQYPSETEPSDGVWQNVNGTEHKFFVFSAFYERRVHRLIRVIGATRTYDSDEVWCRMWYSNGPNSNVSRSATVLANVTVIQEHFDLMYSACFVLCPLQEIDPDVPYAVSIVNNIRSSPDNLLLVRNTDQDPDFANRYNITDIPDTIGICVKPFYNYDSALNLLEFLELNSMLGVSHFTFYNHTLGPQSSCILKDKMTGCGTVINSTIDGITKSYVRPTVTMLPWVLPIISQKEIRTEGIFAALNDCVYRSMYRYRYVALIDVDEFIFPKKGDTFSNLLRQLSDQIPNVGSYSFRNAFFYLQFPDDEIILHEDTYIPLKAALTTQRKTMRRIKLNPHRQRSKYIIKPETVVEAGNHFVWEHLPGIRSLHVPQEVAIMHHYRRCEFGGDDCVKDPSTIDRTAHKYGNELVNRVQQVYNKLTDTCKL